VIFVFFMNLENNVRGNFLQKIKRKVLPYVLAAGVGLAGLAVLGCPQESPGPISVKNIITPATVLNGNNAKLEVKVTNDGAKVTIDKATYREKVVSGWATGLPGSDISGDLPLTDYEIDAHSTETVFTISVPVYNTGPDNVVLEDTVTISSDGGDDSSTCTYTIVSPYSPLSLQLKGKAAPQVSNGVIKGLSDYLK
jgi:hypothetical protein